MLHNHFCQCAIFPYRLKHCPFKHIGLHRYADCTILLLVVKTASERIRKGKVKIMKILLAVDGSDYSDAAVDAVAERPWPDGSTVKIISAVELPYLATTEPWALPDSYYAQTEQVANEQAEEAVREARHRLEAGREKPIEIIGEVRAGRAEDVIIEEAEQWGADLIVMGSHGYRGVTRFLLGSVSHAVATHAPCSIEIVRQRAK